MPQFDKIIFFNQIFWLIFFFKIFIFLEFQVFFMLYYTRANICLLSDDIRQLVILLLGVGWIFFNAEHLPALQVSAEDIAAMQLKKAEIKVFRNDCNSYIDWVGRECLPREHHESKYDEGLKLTRRLPGVPKYNYYHSFYGHDIALPYQEIYGPSLRLDAIKATMDTLIIVKSALNSNPDLIGALADSSKITPFVKDSVFSVHEGLRDCRTGLLDVVNNYRSRPDFALSYYYRVEHGIEENGPFQNVELGVKKIYKTCQNMQKIYDCVQQKTTTKRYPW